MVKKSIFLATTLFAVGLAFVPRVQAQTKQQQQELEQIAKRSMNGLSPQDRQRVVQIMTDVFTAQGMSKQQAASLAEMSADSMFSKDVGEMSAAERRQFEEQERSMAELEQRRQQQPQQTQAQLPGKTAGWPASQLKKWGIPNLKQPAGIKASYDDADRVLEVYMTGASAETLEDVKRQIEKATGKKMDTVDTNTYHLIITPAKDRFSSYTAATLRLEGDQVILRITESAA